MLLRIMGLEEETFLIPPPPLVAELLVKVVLVMLGEELKLYIPPPKAVTELPVKVVLVMLGEELKLYIPPPLLEAELPVKVALVMLGEEDWFSIPPPKAAELPVKVVLVMLGEEKRLYIPPPPSRRTVCDSTLMLPPPLAFPPLTVNPSMMVEAASDTETTTWKALSDALPGVPMSPLRVVGLAAISLVPPPLGKPPYIATPLGRWKVTSRALVVVMGVPLA
jgi:hypothetical protein